MQLAQAGSYERYIATVKVNLAAKYLHLCEGVTATLQVEIRMCIKRWLLHQRIA